MPGTEKPNASSSDQSAAAADVTRLVSILIKCGTWTPSAEIASRVAQLYPGTRWDGRWISMVAQAAQGRILGTTKGYKVQDHATDDEIRACYHELTERAEQTAKRATDVISYYHRRLKQKQDEAATATASREPDLFSR